MPADWAERCELEWISRDRECRQLVAWHGNLALAPGQHRATILPAACSRLAAEGGLAPRTITGHPKQPIPIADKPNRYIFDIDPAVLAAQLKGVLAAEHELTAFTAGPTYLTGRQPNRRSSARVLRKSKTSCRSASTSSLNTCMPHNIGQLEIKKRGVDIDPEKLRRELKLRGDNAATLLITPIAGRPTAILANRISAP